MSAGTALALLLLLLAPAPARAEWPTKELLEQLSERLLAAPECAPSCASIPRLFLEAKPRSLRVRLEINAAAATAIPLVGGGQWVPAEVLLDGKAASGLAQKDGTIWIGVLPGYHQVILDGPLSDQESVQLAFPLKPHRVEAAVEGWRVEGLHEDGLADEDLQLTRVRAVGSGAGLQPGVLPPFVRVERTLQLGLTWQVHTRVVRSSPSGAAVVLELPLLPGESVATAEVRVVGGKALVNLGPQETETAWVSVLKETSVINLIAPRALAWIETWRVDASPIWHVTPTGIPAIHPEGGGRASEWRPWPGETVRLTITRPAGVPGQTVTIDESRYEVEPGLRATDALLTLTIRSSRGAEHLLTLPAGALLESVHVDGKSQPIRQVEQKVALALTPGSQTIQLAWREPRGFGLFYRVTPADLGVPSVNATIEVKGANARWVLFLGGPRLGPVVLFWSLLLVLFVLSLGLARVKWVPVRSWQWMLLGIGLSQIELLLGVLVVGWLFLLGWRGQSSAEPRPHRFWFNTRQLVILLLTVVALIILMAAVHEGLLGQPDMQVRGNGSSVYALRWFQDRCGPIPDAPWVLSMPLLIYRLAMLAWALWLALAVLGWLRWGWRAFSGGGSWRRPLRQPGDPDGRSGEKGKAGQRTPDTTGSGAGSASAGSSGLESSGPQSESPGSTDGAAAGTIIGESHETGKKGEVVK